MSECGHTRFHDLTDGEIDELAAAFASASPFPHVVLRDFLRGDSGSMLESFPSADWSGWQRFRDDYQAGKMFADDIERIPSPFDDLIHELSSPSFLRFLERVCGERGLIPDPYLEGGGLHCSRSGGVLAPHTDFHLYRRLGLYRRLNVLLYLNPGWTSDDGACLELWRKGASEPDVRVVPSWGTCVVFRTDDRSVHGFSQPVNGEDRWRRSIALYYYSSVEHAAFAGDVTTYWQQHGTHHGIAKARLALYRGLIFGARGLALLAHRANPNVGSRKKPR